MGEMSLDSEGPEAAREGQDIFIHTVLKGVCIFYTVFSCTYIIASSFNTYELLLTLLIINISSTHLNAQMSSKLYLL